MGRRTVMLVGTFVAACGAHPQGVGPGDVIGPGMCTIAPYVGTLTAAPECVLSPNSDPDAPCECEDYAGNYPVGVYDADEAAVSTVPGAYPDAKFDDQGHIKGCSDLIRYAMPDCTTLAEISGYVATEPQLATYTGGDDDWFLNMCPIVDTMRRHPFDTTLPSELRGHGSFAEDAIRGRVHVELQECRLFNGFYYIDEPTIPEVYFESRAQRTDLISAAGDWAWDAGHDDEGGGWTEIHEARVLATTRPITPTVSYSMLSAFFAEESLQESVLDLDVKIPASNVPDHTFLDCYVPDRIQNDRPNPKVVGQMIPASQDPTVHGFVGMAPGCPTKGVFSLQADSTRGVCQFHMTRNSTSVLHEFNCQGTCDKLELDPLDCGPVTAAMAIRSEWLDPGDTWVCGNCGCGDPSSPGATIAAPVQGCAEAGLDPQSPADQAKACAQVCAGFVCGAAPDCRIGTCSAPTSQPVAELIGRSTCDPELPVPPGRVASAADYHVSLDSSLSTIKIVIGSRSTTQPAFGEFFFNKQGTVVDFASSMMGVSHFEVHGRDVTDSRVFTVQRMFANMTNGTDFFVPAGIGAFGARALVDGDPAGINATNPEALFGTLDIDNRHFTLEIAATNPEETDQKLIAHLEGVIDNVPPRADPGALDRTIECTSTTTTTVQLSAAASSDVDLLDSITHYQWFDAATGTGLGNTQVSRWRSLSELPSWCSTSMTISSDRTLRPSLCASSIQRRPSSTSALRTTACGPRITSA